VALIEGNTGCLNGTCALTLRSVSSGQGGLLHIRLQGGSAMTLAPTYGRLAACATVLSPRRTVSSYGCNPRRGPPPRRPAGPSCRPPRYPIQPKPPVRANWASQPAGGDQLPNYLYV